MKLFIALSALIALSNAKKFYVREPEGCEFCRVGVKTLFASANTAEGLIGLINVMALLNENVCPGAPDPTGCEAGVAMWWSTISHILFSEEAVPYICHYLNEDCEAPMFNVKAWDCDTCIADLNSVADLYLSDEGQTATVDFLSGEGFCELTDLHLSEEGLSLCKEIIGGFMPPALQVIFGSLKAGAKEVCHDTYDGICG